MGLVGDPIPSRPAAFTPEGAPPGVAVDFESYRRHNGVDGPWCRQRPTIRPTTQVVHTNAAGGEGSTSSQVNWANSSKNNTHAHYNVNAPQPTKHCPTDRRGIGNSTGEDLRRSAGVKDSSFWSIVIETADMGQTAAKAKGIDWGVDCGPFIHDHAEIVARILAFESIVWDIPLAYPTKWTESGTICHTDPFPYPHFTTKKGKTCPGSTKKDQLQHDILPRANEIRAAWVGEPSPAGTQERPDRAGESIALKPQDGARTPAPSPVDASSVEGVVRTMRALKNGDSGREVKVMQHLLAAAGYLDEGNPKNYDGNWRTGTDAAKERFDRDHGLHTPGDTSCGPRSWESLLTGRTW
jgi:hypothetical protein